MYPYNNITSDVTSLLEAETLLIKKETIIHLARVVVFCFCLVQVDCTECDVDYLTTTWQYVFQGHSAANLCYCD